MTAIVRELVNGDVELRTPYNAGFVAALKSMIPWDCRDWDQERKVWSVDAIYANEAIRIVTSWYADVQVIRYQASAPPPPPSSSSDPFRILHLLPSAPGPLIHAAYRTLARLYHPDTGGDTTTMQRINAAYDRLKDHAS